MENKELEDGLDGLREKLHDYTPDGLQPDWEAFTHYLEVHDQVTQWEDNEAFDESLKESVSQYSAPGMQDGWHRMEEYLNEADKVFDEEIRHRIHQFQPTYQPGSWQKLKQQISGISYLRAKLIAFKTFEAAAVVLFLITVLKMGQMGKLPFDTPFFDQVRQFDPIATKQIADGQLNKKQLQDTETTHGNGSPNASAFSPEAAGHTVPSTDHPSSGTYDTEVSDFITAHRSKKSFSLDPIPYAALETIQPDSEDEADNFSISIAEPGENILADDAGKGRSFFKKLQVANFLGTILSPIRWNSDKGLPKPSYVKQRSRTYAEFGIVSQVDYNRLRMPEDRLYSAGRMIVFPQQGIPSASYGGGFSIALAHPRWALESGMIYTEKSFKPGREFKVGESINYVNVEFESMNLQLVSFPVNFRYRFDHKGAFKFYGLGGLGLNLIAQSDINLAVEYHFPSLPPGGNPTAHPAYSETNRETKRVREHIRDGAPFSTKNFFTFTGGAGAEYAMSEHKTIFLQSALQYQVPDLKFSNNNGKHLRSWSIQAGVRSPLGN